MSSFRNHRVIIASLFLPSTAVLGESHPSTPELGATREPPPPPMRLPENVHMPRPGPVHRPTTTPVLSLVDDLKDKVCSPFHVRFYSTSLDIPGLRAHNTSYMVVSVKPVCSSISGGYCLYVRPCGVHVFVMWPKLTWTWGKTMRGILSRHELYSHSIIIPLPSSRIKCASRREYGIGKAFGACRYFSRVLDLT